MVSSQNLVRCAVCCLLTIHALLLLDSARRDFATVDEYAHVPAGIAHLQTGTYHLYEVNPPLARMLAVLPVLLARPQMDYGQDSEAPGARSEWTVAADFIRANSDHYFELIRL